jgi:ATP-dependent RNA helicase SUPV3L1/SUV3
MPAVPEAISQAGGSAPLDAVAAAASGLEASETPQDQPDAIEAANSVEPAAEEPLIEIWRPHRQQHSRRPEARTRKSPLNGTQERRPEVAPPPPQSRSRKTRRRARRLLGNRRPAPELEMRCWRKIKPDPARKAFKGRHKDSGGRGAGEPGQRFEVIAAGGRGGQARGNPDERKEGGGERFAVRRSG